MKDEENMVWSASKVLIVVAVVASVAVTVTENRFIVALILLLVDPIDDVLIILRICIASALASTPRARRVLRT